MQGHARMVSLVEGLGFRVGGKYLVWPRPKLIGMQANAGKQGNACLSTSSMSLSFWVELWSLKGGHSSADPLTNPELLRPRSRALEVPLILLCIGCRRYVDW